MKNCGNFYFSGVLNTQNHLVSKRQVTLQSFDEILSPTQRYTHRVLQTIQIELILLCVWAEPAVLGSAKTALKFKYEI